jgi:hypothetical protein
MNRLALRRRRACSVLNKGKHIPVLDWLSLMPWRCIVEWRHSSTILKLSTRFRLMVRFKPRLLYPQGKIIRCSLYKRGWQVFGFIKKTATTTTKENVIYSSFSPWAPHTYDFVVLTSVTHSMNILLFVVQTTQIQGLTCTPTYTRPVGPQSRSRHLKRRNP